MLVGSVAIMGLPFLSGFYSKDVIIELSYLQTSYILPGVSIIYVLIIGATIFTGVYSFRLYYFLFLRAGSSKYSCLIKTAGSQQPFFIQLALGVLMLGSLFSGYFLSDLFQASNI
jgi:NADH-ubiquinone oxidoreductase chain 5